MKCDERRYTSVELLARIIDSNADAHDEVRALALAEQVSRRKFRLSSDRLHRAYECRRLAIDLEVGLRAGNDSGELSFGNEHVGIRMRRVAEGYDGRSGAYELALLDVHVEHDTLRRSDEIVTREALVLELHRCCRREHVRFRRSLLLDARSAPERRELLLERLSLRRCGIEPTRKIVHRRFGRRASREQRLLARQIPPE